MASAARWRVPTPACSAIGAMLRELVARAEQMSDPQNHKLPQPSGHGGAGQRGASGEHPADERLPGMGQRSVDVHTPAAETR